MTRDKAIDKIIYTLFFTLGINGETKHTALMTEEQQNYRLSCPRGFQHDRGDIWSYEIGSHVAREPLDNLPTQFEREDEAVAFKQDLIQPTHPEALPVEES